MTDGLYGRETKVTEERRAFFPKKKTTMPEKGRKAIKDMLTGIRSETLGTNYNKPHTNISNEESEALKTLISLQKSCQIIVKPYDKGAGI